VGWNIQFLEEESGDYGMVCSLDNVVVPACMARRSHNSATCHKVCISYRKQDSPHRAYPCRAFKAES